MRYVVTAQEMKKYDRNTTELIGIPALVLMEQAALSVVEVLREKRPEAKRVLIVAGVGNNGGDGLAVGRILAQQGLSVDFVLAGDAKKMTQETACQVKIVQNLGFSLSGKLEKREYDIVVDALFGVGLSREVEGESKALVEEMNYLRREGAFLCSVDLPSGIDADTGEVLGCAVYADMTVTFSFAKRGLLFYPGRAYAGERIIKEIGITSAAFDGQVPKAFCYEKEDVWHLPGRAPDGNKGTFGKVLLAAGSRDMSGACVLCGESVLRTGAGMLKIITPECNRQVVQTALPEALLYSYEEKVSETELQKSLDWADVLLAGPGMGTGKEAGELLEYFLTRTEKPLVLDADGLNLLAASTERFQMAARRKNLIITPHPGELGRLLHRPLNTATGKRMEEIKELTENLACILVAKDAVTMVTGPGEIPVYVNTSGNDGMATAGSGDVLAGVIGSLLAQGMEAFEAATLGVYLHGLAGEAASAKMGKRSVLASDLIRGLAECLMDIEENGEKTSLRLTGRGGIR